jgi:hypothetical protein
MENLGWEGPECCPGHPLARRLENEAKFLDFMSGLQEDDSRFSADV